MPESKAKTASSLLESTAPKTLARQPNSIRVITKQLTIMTSPSLHPLLLLSDSALPLGSFAFSSGLESFLAHTKTTQPSNKNNSSIKLPAFNSFLHDSLANVASTALPYVVTAYQHPERVQDLDNEFDASTPCTVAKRASVAQGKALLAIWERALSFSTSAVEDEGRRVAAEELDSFATASKTSSKADNFGLQLNAHFPPLFGAVGSALGLSKEEMAYLFLLNHTKAVLSAAVRSGVMGPYQSQAVLASGKLRESIEGCIDRERDRGIEDAAVTVPTMDLWMGRHELLYSRIFNS